MPRSRLTYEERLLICACRKDGLSVRATADEVGRDASTISRELRRNLCKTGYRATVAHHRARVRARRPKAFELECHSHLARWVERLLEDDWSPEQISNRLRKEHPDDPRWWVSPEAIYKALYVQGLAVPCARS